MEKIKIFVCCHKDGFYIENDVYQPIQVGRALSSDKLKMIGDDSGDNISVKNRNYCELTAQYWIWKNFTDAEYVGLCHYRRYFDLSSSKRWHRNVFVSEKEAIERAKVDYSLLGKYDAIISYPLVEFLSLRDSYCMAHIAEDLKVLEKVIVKLYPDYYADYKKVMFGNNQYSYANMIIVKKVIFDDYSKWLFDILFEVEKEIEISNYNYQARVFGFMSERLMNVYLYHNKIKITKRAILTVDTKNNTSCFRNVCSKILRNLLFKINNRIKHE